MADGNVSDTNVEQQFPDFKGKVIKRGDDDYDAQCYQYASSSYLKESIIQPAAIINNAADDNDVIKDINYAKLLWRTHGRSSIQ